MTVGSPPSPLLSQVFILKGVKVVCFDTLLQVLILKVVRRDRFLNPFRRSAPPPADWDALKRTPTTFVLRRTVAAKGPGGGD